MDKQRNSDENFCMAADIQRQRIEWRKKGWSIPDLRGSKQIWFSLVKELVELVGDNQVNDLEAYPDIHIISQPQPWRSYAPFLKGIGLVSNQAGRLCLSDEGIKFCKEPTKRHLAEFIQDRFRLFGEVLDSASGNIEIADPPEEIAMLLQRLTDSPEMHKKRSTYNIWVPSPNRIDNLRLIVQAASERISRVDFFNFIGEEFNLKASSVESMLPFLKVSGLIEEVGRNVYIAAPAAKAWLETGNDLDFIRILHSNMQFVGEMIKAAEHDIIRNDIYAQAKLYGLNNEKARWIAGFLIEAGLLEETQYLHLKATPIGMCFASSLPLSEMTIEVIEETDIADNKEHTADYSAGELEGLVDRLRSSSRNPVAEGKASGVAFEEAIADIFQFMGFKAERIGGPGDTDVVVRWQDDEGKSITAIIDGKSKSGGHVSHSDISDIAIDTHKEKNNAEYVAIIGPNFSGDTIRNHAMKKAFALITDTQLIEIAQASQALGLSLQEMALVFQVPDGLSQLDEIISLKQRELDIISIVVSRFCKEQETLGYLSPRDLFLLLRDTDVSPSLKELIGVFETLSKPEIGVLSVMDAASSPENTKYLLKETRKTANRLRALALALDKGVSD